MQNHEEVVEILKIGMSIAKEQFKENELFICKGRRLQMKDIINHLKVCVDSIKDDLERGVDARSVLDTTVNAMKNMIKALDDELAQAPNLISKDITEDVQPEAKENQERRIFPPRLPAKKIGRRRASDRRKLRKTANP